MGYSLISLAVLLASQASPTAQSPAPQTAVLRPIERAATSPSTPQQTLALACAGEGTANKESLLYDTKPALVTDQVDVRLFGGDDRIRLPRAMVPIMHGGSDGWFKLKNVVADAKTIRAIAPLNFYSNLKVYIDRVTGAISISGDNGDYSGECQVVDPNAPAKF